jgi:hypothetical protein
VLVVPVFPLLGVQELKALIVLSIESEVVSSKSLPLYPYAFIAPF